MPAPTSTRPMPPRADARAAGERGFTVVEITVVLVIVLILISIAIVAMHSAKGAAYGKEAIAAGAAYSDGIAKFQTDHAGANPAAGDMTTLNGKPAGPKNLLNKAYTAPIPDGVVNGRIFVDMSGGGANCASAASQSGAPANANAVVSYCPGTAPAFGVRVLYKQKTGDSWANAKWCWHGSGGQMPRC